MNIQQTTLPAWASMWLLAGLLFFSGKLAGVWTLLKLRQGIGSITAYMFLWVGMNPYEWVRPVPEKIVVEKWRPLMMAGLGVLLLWGVARHLGHPLLAGWCGMVGLILLLHFGAFHGLAVFWQARHHGVHPLMNRPVAARRLSEFWGRRWNRAFRDLVHPLVFVPLHRHWGSGVAMWSCFAVSGVAHEMVISLPAGTGYGLPMAYFLLQALGITVERRFRVQSWWFTHAFTLPPALLLFHPHFIERVMLPFFQTIHALP